MAKFIIAEKLNMSQMFTKDGKVVPVTVLKAGPVMVVQVKTADKDKYTAVQVGFGKKKHPTKAEAGHGAFKTLAEFRTSDKDIFTKGQEIKVDTFVIGDKVKVTAEMKGRGFAGPIKRHGFKGAPASHGHDHPRAVGAIGGRFPQHVRKGLRMAGHMAGVRTVTNLEVIDVDVKRNLIAVKGAVPGANGGIVKIQAS
ncbi:MAG: 50S ribosomal protein L3 [Candidatus Doudnabacteria bacterium RIFCSPLOWO2_02_FULL_49_13]|uniref:50S ribosomal protein L3 n=1 Tax=Candidatus Doudnabacteria bacterium RIFCSPHIGHO2_12_FULL_48_16 TaxID=1817838 RepID=A0A1F5PJN1_9BACT|nr:ribosomal protein L3 [uncultured bacterium]OGE87781.1 MAG: 50S ribosomal protein L3 [Candidatus Doudnabacteria bacterium RIFCSPHIGHO2_02_FULL_49_24]OGE88143.1 MAG: 50S ribosomal protein L3 [Candidatus Doudnabacteria bacterium RIFCSPHIGHO2_01_FULL_50_67]OGE90014.1 MAG: 50S ribosomal protein L3 [Candidatus Doudnabacteria bacterium RIFCSPHIGHO2_12_FULL_48_16]OGE96587.1 MAG: 50S ribosomal protein L3 [Candidatus Doudnabacteria bacterium RIFCSPLOWO2_01_FULL_49_40]OGF03157.1 MAG: 50S ribosomal pro